MLFWVNWHKKLVQDLGANVKSDIVSVQQATNSPGPGKIVGVHRVLKNKGGHDVAETGVRAEVCRMGSSGG